LSNSNTNLFWGIAAFSRIGPAKHQRHPDMEKELSGVLHVMVFNSISAFVTNQGLSLEFQHFYRKAISEAA
jgi:hypothetical protein